jgi:hypothetical protein
LALETGLGTAAETQINADKNTRETDDKNRMKRTVYILTGISPNTWWARSENHRGRAI